MRDGDTVKTYDSADGASWDLIGDYAQPMVDTAYVGLAVTSHNDGTLCTAEFDSFDLGDTPTAVGEVYLSPANQDIDEAAGALLANDTDPNGGPMTTVLDTDVSNGTLSLGDDGSFTYSPDVDFVGTDSFTYYVVSGSFTSASVTVELDIYDDTNTAPVITAPAEEICYGQALWFGSQTASRITIDDEDSGTVDMQLDLTVDLGTLSITDTAGAAVVSGDVNGDTSIVLQGSANDLNDALEQLWWTRADGQIADATLTVEADDLGNTGTGGDLTDQVTVTLRMENAGTDLLAHWTFDDGSGLVAADSVGSYDATFNEVGTLSWIDGVDGGAVHLDSTGGGQKFEAANTDSMQPAAFTIATWVNFDVPFHQMDGAYPCLLNHESWGDKAGFSLGALGNNDDLDLRAMDGSNSPRAITYQYEAGEWLHVSATYDGTDLRIFIDGDLVATEELATPIHYVAGLPLDIGSNFEGALDDMRVYGRALRHDELIALAESNTAPTLAVNDGLTVDEDAAGTIDNTTLQVTDPEQGAADLTFTLETDVTNGVLELDGVELNATDTFTQDDIDNNRLTYTHDGGETTADAFTFTVADGAGGSIAETTFAITVTGVNDAPTLAINAPAAVLQGAATDLSASVGDVDSPEEALTVQWIVLTGEDVLLTGADGVAPTVTFTRPGEHVLRVTAGDGQDETTRDITIQSIPIAGPDPADETPESPLPSDTHADTDRMNTPAPNASDDEHAPSVTETSDDEARDEDGARLKARSRQFSPPRAPGDEPSAPEVEALPEDGAVVEEEDPGAIVSETQDAQETPSDEQDGDTESPTADRPERAPSGEARVDGDATPAPAGIPEAAADLPPDVALQRYGDRYAHAAEAQWRQLELMHVWQAVDSVEGRMTEHQAAAERIETLTVGTAAGVSVAATVCYLAWSFRSASWVAAMLAACPPWVCMDPLPILEGKAKPRKSGKTEPDEDDTEKRVGSLLDR